MPGVAIAMPDCLRSHGSSGRLFIEGYYDRRCLPRFVKRRKNRVCSKQAPTTASVAFSSFTRQAILFPQMTEYLDLEAWSS